MRSAAAAVPTTPWKASPTRRPSRACASSQARSPPGGIVPPCTSMPPSASGSALCSVANNRSRRTRNSSSSKRRWTASRFHGRTARSSGRASSGTSRTSSVSCRLSTTPGQVRPQRIARLALHLVDPVGELGERAELPHPLRGRLLPDARDRGQVVGRVAAQRREIRVLGGREPVARHDRIGIDPAELGHPARGVEHRDVVADQLERIAIAGGDEHLEAVGLGLRGEGGDQVVGLEAGHAELGDGSAREDLLDEIDLAAEIVGRGGAVGLVLGVALRPERLP